MATKRDNGVFYFDRHLSTLKTRVKKTLNTRRFDVANRREMILLTLDGMGRKDILGLFVEGRVGADQIEAAWAAGALDGLVHLAIQPPLRQALAATLADKGADLKTKSAKRYRECADHFMRILGETTPVSEALTTGAVQRYKAARKGEGAADGTVNNELAVVSVLTSYALREGWITDRPVIKRYKTPSRTRYLEPHQKAAYMQAMEPRYRVFFDLLMSTGMRLGEAMALRVSDLKFADGYVNVRDAKSPAGVRHAFLPSWVGERIQDWIEEHGLGHDDKLFGFLGFRARSLQRAHEKACEKAKIVDYRLHDHRHTAAVDLCKAGAPLNLVQKQLGHSKITQTMRYAAFHAKYADLREYFRIVQENGGGNDAEE